MNAFARALIASLALASAVVAFYGCNTVKGAGRDLEKAGEAIERAAD